MWTRFLGTPDAGEYAHVDATVISPVKTLCMERLKRKTDIEEQRTGGVSSVDSR